MKKRLRIWSNSIIILLLFYFRRRNAIGQYNRIADEILKLDTLPERFRIMEAEPEHTIGMRRMLVDNYSVFYVVREDKVIVTDVLYSASDIEERLKNRINE